MMAGSDPINSPLGRVFAPQPAIYLGLIIVAIVAFAAYGFRNGSLFGCQPPVDEKKEFVAYCGAKDYGDYDHGAFWFDLEPAAVSAAAGSETLFIGNSRMQFALSSETTRARFAASGHSYYLLGFAFDGNYNFFGPLLQRVRPGARAYVVNLDLFFEPEASQVARAVMHGPDAASRYGRKRALQRAHFIGCTWLHALCGRDLAFYRAYDTGSWRFSGGRKFPAAQVSYDGQVDAGTLAAYLEVARQYLDALPVAPECQVLTMVATAATPLGTARELARLLDRPFIAPQPGHLMTFDGSHLDQESADLWTAAFLDEAMPRITACLEGTTAQAPTPGRQ
jgi:hypothetical protein